MNFLKITATLLIGISVKTAISQDVAVPFKKKSFVSKSTASWCTPCGDYAYVGDSIHHYYGDSIAYLNMHVASSTIGDPSSGDIHNVINPDSGVPSFNVNGEKCTSWPPTVDEILDNSRSFATTPIIANIAYASNISNGELTINISTKFFESDSGTFYVAAYPYEDDITYQQKFTEPSSGNSVYQTHTEDRICRGTILMPEYDNSIWGATIRQGQVQSGAINNVSFTRTIENNWIESNLGVIVVLWKEVDSVFEVLSAEDVQGVLGLESESDLFPKLKVYPNPVQNSLIIESSVMDEFQLKIFDLNGRLVLKTSTTHLVDVSNLMAGEYIIELSSKDRKQITQFIKK